MALLGEWLSSLSKEETMIGVSYLAAKLPQGKVGIGPAALRKALARTAADNPSLELAEIDQTLEAIRSVSGAGSSARRQALLDGLFSRATEAEQSFLAKLLMGELRQGALGGLLLEAVSRFTGIGAPALRRAAMVHGDLAEVTSVALLEGEQALGRFRVELMRPLLPMLAQPVDGLEEAFERLAGCEAVGRKIALEHKIDGARVQVHRSGETVRVYTRRLHDVTRSVPEIVDAISKVESQALILDGEAYTVQEDGSPLPFQTTMRRFGRKLDVDKLKKELPLEVRFFDCLYRDGRELLHLGTEERLSELAASIPQALQIERLVTGDLAAAAAFYERAIEQGHEGIMVKALYASYEAGARGKAWCKIKPTHTLDLVVLAAEWGHGRRRGWLSNLHLGTLDDESTSTTDPQFVMLGKTFKGLTDQLLAWQTEKLLELETHREGITVFVEPKLVVEIAFNDIQESPQYPGGMALRFARVKGYREDKTALDADSLSTVRQIFEKGRG